MLRDEELSEEEFKARAHRIALEAHEDRLKLWESLHTDPRTGARLSDETCDPRMDRLWEIHKIATQSRVLPEDVDRIARLSEGYAPAPKASNALPSDATPGATLTREDSVRLAAESSRPRGLQRYVAMPFEDNDGNEFPANMEAIEDGEWVRYEDVKHLPPDAGLSAKLQEAIDLLYECRDALSTGDRFNALYQQVWGWCRENRNAAAQEPEQNPQPRITATQVIEQREAYERAERARIGGLILDAGGIDLAGLMATASPALNAKFLRDLQEDFKECDRLAALSNEALVLECIRSDDDCGAQIVVEMWNRLYPGWKESPDAKEDGPHG